MNFIEDLKEIAESFLDSLSVSYDKSLSAEEIIRIYVNVQNRLIKPQPRKVLRSTKLSNSNLDNHTKQVLDEIERKSNNGENLNPHLSKGLLKGKYTDLLFADWRIYHLHLNMKFEKANNTFIKRSKNVLFVWISDNTMYFIDIRPHGRNGEKYVFAKEELIEIIYNEWKDLLIPFKIEAKRVEWTLKKAEDIDKFRRSGLNGIYEIKNEYFASIGGGITTAGTAGMTTMRYIHLIKMIRDITKIFSNPPQHIDSALRNSPEYAKDKVKYRLLLHDDGCFYVIEESTMTVFKIG